MRKGVLTLSSEDIKKEVIKCFGEVGIIINEDENDIDINSYGIDSIMYISFVIELEYKIGITIPDQYLQFDNFSSLNAFSNVVFELYCEQNALNKN